MLIFEIKKILINKNILCEIKYILTITQKLTGPPLPIYSYICNISHFVRKKNMMRPTIKIDKQLNCCSD